MVVAPAEEGRVNALPSPLLALIDALAENAAADYLRLEAANQHAMAAERTNPVPLPELDRAA